jgi:microcin C transport system permease protein
MTLYIFRRLLLIIPTLWAIITINFFIVQLTPGGPVDQAIARLNGVSMGISAQLGQETPENFGSENIRGIDPTIIKELEKFYGFDQPIWTRYLKLIKQYMVFDLGKSFLHDRPVWHIIKEKLPVSLSLGLWTTLLMYLISIPLGMKKAILHGTSFDTISSLAIIIGYAIPSFLLAIFLMVFFAGGTYLDWFPLRGMISDHWHKLSWWGKIADYLWHMVLPVLSLVIGGFASLTLLMKNAVLEEIHKPYVLTAQAKGLSPRRVLYGHIFRNAILVIIAGFPQAFSAIFFTGSVLIEVIFSLDGLGLLGFDAALNRDYPIVFGVLYIYTIAGLVLNLIGDILYKIVDPRIHFN